MPQLAAERPIGQVSMMDHERSDFLADEVRAVNLSGWADILPARYSVLGGNLFAEIFLADETGAVHMLEVPAASIARSPHLRTNFVSDASVTKMVGCLGRWFVSAGRRGSIPAILNVTPSPRSPCSAESISPTMSGYAHGANGSATGHRSTRRPKICQTARQCRSRLLTEGLLKSARADSGLA